MNPTLKKLQVKPGIAICVLGAPDSYQPVLKSAPGEVKVSNALRGRFQLIHLFATRLGDVEARAPKLKAALEEGGILWISYPKGKAIETDMNRDILFKAMQPLGLQAVAQVAIDETWSALRFKVTG